MAEAGVKVYYGNLMMLPDVARVIACLHEKEVQFELLDMNKGRHPLSSEFFKLQASSRVRGPAFYDGAKVLFDSRAICRYVSEKYEDQGNRYLLGRDLLERSSIEQWLKSEEHSFDPPSWTLVFSLAFAPSLSLHPDPSQIDHSERKLSEVLDVYDQRLAESKYLAGSQFSLADLAHLPHSHYLANSRDWGHLFADRKHVSKWWKRISERESWKRAAAFLEDNRPDTTVTVSFHEPKSVEKQEATFLTQTSPPQTLPQQTSPPQTLPPQTSPLRLPELPPTTAVTAADLPETTPVSPLETSSATSSTKDINFPLPEQPPAVSSAIPSPEVTTAPLPSQEEEEIQPVVSHQPSPAEPSTKEKSLPIPDTIHKKSPVKQDTTTTAEENPQPKLELPPAAKEIDALSSTVRDVPVETRDTPKTVETRDTPKPEPITSPSAQEAPIVSRESSPPASSSPAAEQQAVKQPSQLLASSEMKAEEEYPSPSVGFQSELAPPQTLPSLEKQSPATPESLPSSSPSSLPQSTTPSLPFTDSAITEKQSPEASELKSIDGPVGLSSASDTGSGTTPLTPKPSAHPPTDGLSPSSSPTVLSLPGNLAETEPNPDSSVADQPNTPASGSLQDSLSESDLDTNDHNPTSQLKAESSISPSVSSAAATAAPTKVPNESEDDQSPRTLGSAPPAPSNPPPSPSDQA